MDPAVGTRIGRYEIRSVIGDYATDVVYSAWDAELDRPLVLKTHRSLDGHPVGEALVRNEAQTLARLDHPGILRIHDAGVHGGRFFFVTEALAASLRTRMAEGLPSPSSLVSWMAEAAEAVGHAHRRGFVHRSLRPETLWFDAEGHARVVAFTLAARRDELAAGAARDGDGAAALSFVGALEYAAPEELQRRHDEVGPPADVWAMGVVLHEALCGELPFSRERVLAAIDGEPMGPPRPPPDAARTPTGVAEVVARCLAERPHDRYRDGTELAHALRNAGAAAEPPLRVFVSHSTRDRDVVEQEIVGFLEGNGVRTWYAKVDIESAARWERTILQGLETCPWFLLGMSPRSAESEWVRDEVHWAVVNRPTRILPVVLEACDPWRFHIRIGRLQHIDLAADRPAAKRTMLERLRRG
jgi:serine/threonine protein kinase